QAWVDLARTVLEMPHRLTDLLIVTKLMSADGFAGIQGRHLGFPAHDDRVLRGLRLGGPETLSLRRQLGGQGSEPCQSCRHQGAVFEELPSSDHAWNGWDLFSLGPSVLTHFGFPLRFARFRG